MSDVISRSGVSAWLANRGYRGLANKVMDKDRFPSAQPEVIRCRDCKWHRFDKDNIPYCYNIDYGYGWKDDDFCSRAERREVSK